MCRRLHRSSHSHASIGQPPHSLISRKSVRPIPSGGERRRIRVGSCVSVGSRPETCYYGVFRRNPTLLPAPSAQWTAAQQRDGRRRWTAAQRDARSIHGIASVVRGRPQSFATEGQGESSSKRCKQARWQASHLDNAQIVADVQRAISAKWHASDRALATPAA